MSFTGTYRVIVKYTDDEGADEKMKECCPGAPFVQFSTKPGVKVNFINPVPMSGLFTRSLVISDGDSYGRVIQKLTKDAKTIKSAQSVQLWRYQDPILGDRKLPEFQQPTKGKILISPDSIFKVNLETKTVSLVSGDLDTSNVGESLVYMVAN